MWQLLQQIIAGLEIGIAYSLVGLAIVVIMKATDVPNFAVAQMGLVAAYLTWFLSASPDKAGVGWNFWLALIIGLAFAAVFGAATQYLLIRPLVGLSNRPLSIAGAAIMTYLSILFLREQGLPSFLDWFPVTNEGFHWGAAIPLGILVGVLVFLAARSFVKPLSKVDHFPLLLLTIGLTWALFATVQLIWGASTRQFIAPWSRKSVWIIRGECKDVDGVVPLTCAEEARSINLTIGADQVIAIGVGLLIAIGVGLFFKSKWGVRMRAIAEDGVTARLLGINSGKISLVAWALGSMVAAAAMIMFTTSTFLRDVAANPIILKGFIASVIGGFTSLLGTFTGGLVIGLGESIVGGQISTAVQETVALLLVVVILLAVPGGLTREKTAREV